MTSPLAGTQSKAAGRFRAIVFRLYAETFVRLFAGKGWATRLGVKRLHHALWKRLVPAEPARFRNARFAFPREDTASSTALYGHYEDFELDLFLESLPAETNVLDIGANIGIFTVLAGLKLSGSNGRVFSLEPAPNNLLFLAKNVELNGLRNVTILPKAASELQGSARLCLGDRSGEHFLAAASADGKWIEVETAPVDSLVPGDTPIHVVKMDVEGSELRALRGMSRILADRALRRVFVEFAPEGLRRAGENPIALPEELRRLGFKIFLINEENRSLERTAPDEALRSAEQRKVVNLLAER